MEQRTYYYARVSSKEQNLDRQLAAFTSLGAQERDIITDKESGKDLDRAGYKALKTALLRRGDTLVIKSLDRSIAQQERETILQRQTEGIAAAKARGKRFGRPKVEKPDNWNEVIALWKAGEITAVEAMRRTGIKRSTFYKLNG